MQDYPKLLKNCDNVGFTDAPHLLRLCGAEVEECKHEFAGGVELPFYPMIDFSPRFATCLTVTIR